MPRSSADGPLVCGEAICELCGVVKPSAREMPWCFPSPVRGSADADLSDPFFLEISYWALNNEENG